MKKHLHSLGDWRRNVLLVAAAGSLGLALPACSSNDTAENRRDQATDGQDNGAEGTWGGETYSQGVITEMTEVQPGEWKITAERPAGKEEVAAVLRHFDGKVDTLQGQALQRQMQEYSRANPENRVQGNGMMNVLMWSGIGFMAGRYLTPNPGYYASPGVLQNNQGWRANVANERQRQGRGFFGRGFSGAGTSANAGIQESRTTARSSPRAGFRSSAPAGRSSGFGGRGGRGFGG